MFQKITPPTHANPAQKTRVLSASGTRFPSDVSRSSAGKVDSGKFRRSCSAHCLKKITLAKNPAITMDTVPQNHQKMGRIQGCHGIDSPGPSPR